MSKLWRVGQSERVKADIYDAQFISCVVAMSVVGQLMLLMRMQPIGPNLAILSLMLIIFISPNGALDSLENIGVMVSPCAV